VLRQIDLGEAYEHNGFSPLPGKEMTLVIILGLLTCGFGFVTYFLFTSSHVHRCQQVVLAVSENHRLEAEMRRKIASWERECRELLPAGGDICALPVKYKGWEGSVHTFVFYNYEYAHRFKVLNAKKLVAG